MLTFQSVLGIPVRWERLFASQDAQKPVFYYNGICLQSQVFCNKTNPILLHVQQKTAMHNCTAALYFRKIRVTFCQHEVPSRILACTLQGNVVKDIVHIGGIYRAVTVNIGSGDLVSVRLLDMPAPQYAT